MYLLISKDKEEIRRALDSFLKEITVPLINFYAETFSSGVFFQEIETLPFLTMKKVIVIYDLDQLPKDGIDTVQRYLEKPNSWITLYLTATELAPQSKLVKAAEKRGKVVRFQEEKPWEKEKRLGLWLVEEAKKENVQLKFQAAAALVQGVDHQSLRVELEKLICFVGDKKEITLDDISLISTPAHHETLWQFGEALFTCSLPRALEMSSILLEEEMNILMILGSLRSQFITGIEILSLGKEAVKKFPYLKGNLLDKKLHMFKKFGKERLLQGALLIFDAEVKTKNSAIEPELLLQLLIIKICHDSFSSSQSVGSSY